MRPVSDALRFGFAPAHGASDAATAGRRLATYLTRRAGVRFVPFVASSYGTLVKGFAEGWVDVGWLPPFVYVMAARAARATPLARFVRLGQPSYKSAFLVRDKSPLRTLADLRGKRMAYTDPRSSAGYLAPRGYLMSLGLDPDELFSNQAFVGSHKRVVEAVLTKTADVGATFFSPVHRPDGGVEIGATAWHQHYPTRAKELRVLAETPAIPSDVIAARAGCPPETAARVRDAFVRMQDEPEGRELLGSIFNAERAIVAHAADYAEFERIVPAARVPSASPRRKP